MAPPHALSHSTDHFPSARILYPPLCNVHCIQATSELFRDMRKLARSEISQRKTKLIGSLVECNFVELVQKMWKQYLRPELLDKDEDLPNHILTSLGVNIQNFMTLHFDDLFILFIQLVLWMLFW